jgi:DHA1 family tetracycline resistance protein-like MFS transporter
MKINLPLFHIIVTLLLNTLSVSLIVPFHPQLLNQLFYNGDLNASAKWFGWQMSIIALLQFLSRPLLGLWSDRIQNRRKILLLQNAATCVSYFMITWVSYVGEKEHGFHFSNDLLWYVYIASRILFGLLSNIAMIAFTYVGDLSDSVNKASNFGLIGMSVGLAFSIGPTMGALLQKFVGEQTYLGFALATLFCLASFIYTAIFVVDSIQLKKDEQGRNNEFRYTENSSLLSMIAASNPLKSFSILFSSGRPLFVLSIVVFLFGLGNTGFFSVWISYASYRYNFTSYESSLFLTGIGIGHALFQGLLMKHFVIRFGEYKTAMLSLFGATMTYLGLALANKGWMTFAVIPVASFGSMADPLLKSIGSKKVGQASQGTLQGAFGSLITLSGIISPVLLAYLFSIFTSSGYPNIPGAPFLLCAFSIFLSFLLMVLQGTEDRIDKNK